MRVVGRNGGWRSLELIDEHGVVDEHAASFVCGLLVVDVLPCGNMFGFYCSKMLLLLCQEIGLKVDADFSQHLSRSCEQPLEQSDVLAPPSGEYISDASEPNAALTVFPLPVNAVLPRTAPFFCIRRYAAFLMHFRFVLPGRRDVPATRILWGQVLTFF